MPRFVIPAIPICNPCQNLTFYHNISISKALSISLQSKSIILNLMVTITKVDVIKRWEEGLCPFRSMVYNIPKKDFVKCIYLRAFSHDSLGLISKIFLWRIGHWSKRLKIVWVNIFLVIKDRNLCRLYNPT